MTEPRLAGTHAALVTPLTADRRIHTADVTRLVRHLVDDGLDGILVAGTTGEGALLHPDQRVELTRAARAAVDTGDREAVLLACATGACLDDLYRDVDALAAAGADAVLVLAPAVYPLTVDELVDAHRGVADRAEVPTLVYHLPQYTGSSLTPDGLRHLVDHPGIVGVKDSSSDDERRLAFAEVARGRSDGGSFAVLSGQVPGLVRALARGVDGSITALANLRPRTLVRLHAAVAEGNVDEAEREAARLEELNRGLKRAGARTAASVKAALQLEGLVEERWCVPPLVSLPGSRLDHVRTALLH